MPTWIGTSGYNYPEWKGSFYPETLPAAKMLPYYAERFSTVEINYTFYRAPNEKILAGWNSARSFFRFGGNWNSSAPSLAPRVAATRQNP